MPVPMRRAGFHAAVAASKGEAASGGDSDPLTLRPVELEAPGTEELDRPTDRDVEKAEEEKENDGG